MKWKLETLAVHAGAEIDAATGAVTPPLHLTTTFERAPDGSYPHGYIYTRTNNPNREALEHALATLEGGEAAACFASGSAAAAAVFRTLRPGDHVIAPDDLYHGITKLLKQVFIPWGLQVSFVDTSSTQDGARSLARQHEAAVARDPLKPAPQNQRRSSSERTRPQPGCAGSVRRHLDAAIGAAGARAGR